MSISYHKPVLLDRVLELLRVDDCRVVVDCTVGDGGFSKAFLTRVPEIQIYGIDLDPEAMERAKQRLAPWSDRFHGFLGNFRDVKELIPPEVVGHVDAVVADLGVSFLQLSEAKKGFMFSENGPLDMKMGPAIERDAFTVINKSTERELADIFFHFGEERQSRRIARAVVRQRQSAPIETTTDLAEIVRNVSRKDHVVKTLARIFQALRIYVNDELSSLDHFLPRAISILRPGGRLAILSYHSLEDRRVKRFIHAQEHPCTCPPQLPVCICGKKPTCKSVSKLVRPDADEIEINKSARSARLRAVEKC